MRFEGCFVIISERFTGISIMKFNNSFLLSCGSIAIILLALPLWLHAAPIRNVILCIGDGMGPEQVKAARCYVGTNLFFEAFPYQSSMTTWSANSPITDSGASGTAMATGHKVNNEVISMQIPGDGRNWKLCSNILSDEVNLLAWSQLHISPMPHPLSSVHMKPAAIIIPALHMTICTIQNRMSSSVGVPTV